MAIEKEITEPLPQVRKLVKRTAVVTISTPQVGGYTLDVQRQHLELHDGVVVKETSHSVRKPVSELLPEQITLPSGTVISGADVSFAVAEICDRLDP